MSTVAMATTPLYQQGWAKPRHVRRFAQTISAPRVPLYQLGWLGVDPARVVVASAPVAAMATTAAIASAGAGTAWGAAAGPIGAAVGLVVGIIAGLWAAHEARAKGARDENAAVNSAVTAFDGAIRAIFDAANSSDPSKNIPASTAAQLCQQQLQTFWQSMQPHMQGPGRADSSGFGAHCGDGTLNAGGACTGTPGGHRCDKSCTAACCVGCQDLYPTILQCAQVFGNPAGGTVQVCKVFGSKYGAVTRAGYSLTYKPPALPTSADGILSSLTGGSGLSLPLIAVAAVAALAVL
jgi:hypothetical protein